MNLLLPWSAFVQKIKNLLFMFIDDPLHLTHGKRKLFRQRFEADSINEPPFHQGSVPLTMHIFLNDLLNSAVCIIYHFTLTLPVP